MAGTPAPPALSRWLAPIEMALQRAIPVDGSPLNAAARYVMGWEPGRGDATATGGKRIRPALGLAAAHAVDGERGVEAALPGAIAVEFVHNFSLVHDDIQDRDAQRHGRPTAWAVYGAAQAINVGDHLHVLAIGSLSSAPGPSDLRVRALDVLNRATSEMLAGQWRDISFENEESVTIDDYLAMIGGKTAALIGAPLEIGAILAGADDGTARRFGEWGRALGLAFQAQDDYLGIWGDPGATGKSNRTDIVRRKKSLPVVAALADPAAAGVIGRAYAMDELTPEAADNVVRALEACGADEAARAAARRYAAAADSILGELAIAEDARSGFREIAAYLVERSA